ncbi:hypothetical protein [Herbidospora galbida]|nr:hypothetical protein [Herbidospora galbida]
MGFQYSSHIAALGALRTLADKEGLWSHRDFRSSGPQLLIGEPETGKYIRVFCFRNNYKVFIPGAPDDAQGIVFREEPQEVLDALPALLKNVT